MKKPTTVIDEEYLMGMTDEPPSDWTDFIDEEDEMTAEMILFNDFQEVQGLKDKIEKSNGGNRKC